MKVSIDIEMPEATRTTKEERLQELEDRVTYAGECIECDAPNAEQAKAFLTRLYNKIDQTPNHTKQLSRLGELIYAILAPYGIDIINEDKDG